MKKFKFRADITAVTIVVFIVCIVLVSVMLMQFRTIEQTDITEIENMRESELRTALSEWKTRYEEIATQLDDVRSRIDEYNQTIEDNEAASELVDEELSESNILVGKTDVYGEGVTVTLSDGDIAVSSDDLKDLVNELRYAGAEAISINENRVLATTDIIDMADYTYIMVNLQRIQGPYVVKAIGNKEQLSSILNMKGSGFIDRAKTAGLNASSSMQNRVEIPKYNGEFEINYMSEVQQEQQAE